MAKPELSQPDILINLAQSGSENLVVFIEGIRIDVWEADKYPHMDTPERRRRVAEATKIANENYFLLTEQIRYIQNLNEKKKQEDAALQEFNRDRARETEPLTLLKETPFVIMDAAKAYADFQAALEAYNKVRDEVMGIIQYRLAALDTLQTRVDQLTDGLINRMADQYLAVYQQPSHRVQAEFTPTIQLGIPDNKFQLPYDEREALLYAAHRVSSALRAGNVALNDRLALKIIQKNALEDFIVNEMNQHIQKHYPNLSTIQADTLKREGRELILESQVKRLQSEAEVIDAKWHHDAADDRAKLVKVQVAAERMAEMKEPLLKAKGEVEVMDQEVEDMRSAGDIASKSKSLEKIKSNLNINIDFSNDFTDLANELNELENNLSESLDNSISVSETDSSLNNHQLSSSALVAKTLHIDKPTYANDNYFEKENEHINNLDKKKNITQYINKNPKIDTKSETDKKPFSNDNDYSHKPKHR